MTDQTAVIMVLVMGFLYLLAIGFSVAQYVITALGNYGVAKNLGISNPWLAWIPIGSEWLVGRITETFDEKRGIKRAWGRIILTLTLLYTVGFILFYVFYFIFMFAIGSGAMYYLGETEAGAAMVIGLIVFIAVITVFAVLAMVTSGCQMICWYKNFESIVPEKSLKYFILSILVPLAYGILMMKCDKILAAQTAPAPVLTEPAPILTEEPAEEAPAETETCETPAEECSSEETTEE